MTWGNLYLSDANNDSSNSTITFQAGSTQTIAVGLLADGWDSNDLLLIRSTIPGTPATFDFTGTANRFTPYFDNLDIKDNIILDNSSAFTLPIGPTSSINSGNTTGWFNTTLTGTVYSDK